MLNADVDVPKEPFQRVFSMYRIGSGGMKKHVHGLDCLPHTVGYCQTGLGYLRARVLGVLGDHVHHGAH